MSAQNKSADPGKGSAARGTCDHSQASTPRVIILTIEHEHGCRAPDGGVCTCDERDDGGDPAVATFIGKPSLRDMMEWIR